MDSKNSNMHSFLAICFIFSLLFAGEKGYGTVVKECGSESLTSFSQKVSKPAVSGPERNLLNERIEKADNFFKKQRYLLAKETYLSALKIDSTNSYSTEQIVQVDSVLQSQKISIFPRVDFEKPVTLILVLLVIIAYSIASMIILLFFILLDREKRKRKYKKINRLKERYQSAILDYLYEEDIDGTSIQLIEEEATTNFNRRILIDEMIDLSINIKGGVADRLRELYYMLSLNEDTMQKVRSRRWHIRIKGFRESSFMNIDEARPFLIKNLDSKNNVVRSEAQLALVRLNEDDPYGFLDYLQRPFTLWEQTIIHETIVYHGLNIPDFKRWINSPNKTVKIFAIKMILAFKQTEAYEEVKELLYANDEDIRYCSIKTLGKLEMDAVQPVFKEIYRGETHKNKLVLLRALVYFKNDANIPFFKAVLEDEENVWLQVEAAKGIRDVGEEGELELQLLLKSEEYRNYQIILKHVLDKRF